MKHLVLGTALVAALALPASAETRDHSGFNGVSARDGVQVEITVGEGYAVDVTGHDAARVRTQVDGRTLRVGRANRSWWGGNSGDIDATVRITMPFVRSLSASRGGEIRAEGVNSNYVDLNASMGGEVSAAGACTRLDASASMGGVIRAAELRCRNADVSASMGGDVRAHASESYDASASMGGAVNVAGGAANGDASTIMGGAVSQNR